MFFKFLVLFAIIRSSFAQFHSESYFEKKHPDLKAFETAGFVHFGDFSEYAGLKFKQQIIESFKPGRLRDETSKMCRQLFTTRAFGFPTTKCTTMIVPGIIAGFSALT
jgi:hypothetical protein